MNANMLTDRAAWDARQDVRAGRSCHLNDYRDPSARHAYLVAWYTERQRLNAARTTQEATS